MQTFRRYYNMLNEEEGIPPIPPATGVEVPLNPETTAPTTETPPVSADTATATPSAEVEKKEVVDIEKLKKTRNEIVDKYNKEQTGKSIINLTNFDKDENTIGVKIGVNDPNLKNSEYNIVKGLMNDTVFKNNLAAVAKTFNSVVDIVDDGKEIYGVFKPIGIEKV